MHQLDDFDIKILTALQESSEKSYEQIGAIVNLSSASVHRRIKRLKELNIIQKEVAIIDAAKVGISMTMIINVEMEHERLDLLKEFKKKMSKFKEVQQCYYVTGETDFILIVKVKNLKHYEQFADLAFFDHSNVKKFTTNVVLDEVKYGLSLPLVVSGIQH